MTEESEPDGRVLKVSKADGAIRTLANKQSLPSAIAVDGEFVYWVTRGDGTVRKIAKQ